MRLGTQLNTYIPMQRGTEDTFPRADDTKLHESLELSLEAQFIGEASLDPEPNGGITVRSISEIY